MKRLLKALESGRILLMDGAMGTELMRCGCRVPGECCESWNLLQPEQVRAVHRSYLDAGAEVLLTNTFQANPAALAKYGLSDHLAEIWDAAQAHARAVACPETIVLADMGPIEKPRLREAWKTLNACREVDGLLLETWDSSAYLWSFVRANHAPLGPELPILVSYTFRRIGPYQVLRTAFQESPQQCARRASEMGVTALGVNCGSEIDMNDLFEIVLFYRGETELPLFIRPNAGTPVRGVSGWEYPRSPEEMADQLWPLLDAGVRMVGGCCGTTPAHIAAFRRVVDAWNQDVKKKGEPGA